MPPSPIQPVNPEPTRSIPRTPVSAPSPCRLAASLISWTLRIAPTEGRLLRQSKEALFEELVGILFVKTRKMDLRRLEE